MDSLFLSGPLPIAEDELLHFAGRCLWEFRKLDRLWDLEAGQMFADEVTERAFVERLARFEGYERLWHLAPVVIGDSDDRRFQYGWVGADRLFDLDGGDVFAARDDDVLLAVAELDVAVGV